MGRKNYFEIDLSSSHYFHEFYERCTFPECGYAFQEADWTYFGNDRKGNWHHVCENHRDNIDWACFQLFGHLAKNLYRVVPYTVPSYINPARPDPDLWLWRYMDFEKFRDFIENKSIFFAKAITFGDPLECAVSTKDNEEYLNSLRSNAYDFFFEHKLDGLSEKEKKEFKENKIQEEIKDNKTFRDEVLISCWHANDYESEAMWQLYKGENHQTVAVSINMCNLRNAFPKPIHLGRVLYSPYEQVYPSKVRAFRKHISYEHENEIRAVIFPEHIDHKEIEKIAVKKEKGLLIAPDKKYLQIRVYISPWSCDCFKAKVKDLIYKSDWNQGENPNPSILEIIATQYEPIF
jgi:hypothetical protein